MPRTYYIFKSGRLRRKGNTLYLEKEKQESADLEDETQSAPGAQDVELAVGEQMTTDDEAVDSSEALNSYAGKTMAEGASEPTTEPQAAGSERPRPIPIEDVAELFFVRRDQPQHEASKLPSPKGRAIACV
jgi:hypothetical protein